MLTFYGYEKCSTCRNARKWLRARGIEHDFIDITLHPPAAGTLQAILEGGDYALRDLFNRSGGRYRELNMKERMPTIGPDEAVALLSGDGRLVKRPIVTDGRRFTVGFDEGRFEEVWGGHQR